MTSLSLSVGNFIKLRFTPTSYPLWREQALALIERQQLVGHLTDKDSTPTKSKQLHRYWNFFSKIKRCFHSLAKVWLSPSCLDHWNTLKGNSQTRRWPRHRSCSMGSTKEHLCPRGWQNYYKTRCTFKGLYDNLAAIGKPVPKKESLLPSHQSWSSIWDLDNNHVEAPTTIILWVGFTTPESLSKA